MIVREGNHEPPCRTLPSGHIHTIELWFTSEEIASFLAMMAAGEKSDEPPTREWGLVDNRVWDKVSEAISAAARAADAVLNQDRTPQRRSLTPGEVAKAENVREAYMKAAKEGRLQYGADKPRTNAVNWSDR